jgi:hypothetical protein
MLKGARIAWTALAFLGLLFAHVVHAQTTPTLKDVHKVFVAQMPNDLDQYIRAELTKQLNGRITVVLTKDAADAVITGTSTANNSTGASIASRYTGSDVATGAISLVDKTETTVIWSDQAGDHNKWIGATKRGPAKVAERLVSDLKKALDKK